jgi:hypothetical protein
MQISGAERAATACRTRFFALSNIEIAKWRALLRGDAVLVLRAGFKPSVALSWR